MTSDITHDIIHYTLHYKEDRKEISLPSPTESITDGVGSLKEAETGDSRIRNYQAETFSSLSDGNQRKTQKDINCCADNDTDDTVFTSVSKLLLLCKRGADADHKVNFIERT